MNKIRPIAIYLPQFHPIPENDAAWGNGFTEWTNVKNAKQLFEDHYQPHVPNENVGYYDLRDPKTLIKQAALAKKHGIYGFAFYHYWFNGKRLLETPLDNMLKSGSPDFPFCYIWANENWTKRWDGLDNEIIIKQIYSPDDDIQHIRYLCKNVFSDKRYININGKPVFIIYRTELFPDIKQTVKLWRDEVKNHGFKDVYLIRVENLVSDTNPLEIGFDAALEFAPDWRNIGDSKTVLNKEKRSYSTVDYISSLVNIILKDNRNYPWYRCVFPGWDNSPRKKSGSVIYVNNSPDLFQHFVYNAINYTKKFFRSENQYFFINAWNEWGEGCHIEPDLKNGTRYLESISRVLDYTQSAESDFSLFLMTYLKEILKEKNELKKTKVLYESIINSRSYILAQSITKPYSLLISFLRKIKVKKNSF